MILPLLLSGISACTTVNYDVDKTIGSSLPYSQGGDTYLGREVATLLDGKPDMNALYPLDNGMDALGIRLSILERAEKTVDIQTFLMKDDTASLVVSEALLKTADRGVKIRFLLDDVFTTTPDSWLALLDEHENIEVRLFNPISRKGLKGLNYLGDFKDVNRRMHNKSFTVDNRVSLVGGRNIADEYFQLNVDNMFTDFDVVVGGPVVEEISNSFDIFWNHERALPVEYLITLPEDLNLNSVRDDIESRLDAEYSRLYTEARESTTLQQLRDNPSLYYLAPSILISDNPERLFFHDDESMTLTRDIAKVLQSAEKKITMITPYFVPGEQGVDFLIGLLDKGIQIDVITNSLASNNHIPVQGAYSRYRKQVIAAGVNVYEIRAAAASDLADYDDVPETMTLHTKVMFIDDRYMFAGSVNLDPRSLEINTEMGLLIDNAEMISELTKEADSSLQKITYHVVLNEEGELEWHGEVAGEKVVYTHEPDTSAWLRFKSWFLQIAPESQL